MEREITVSKTRGLVRPVPAVVGRSKRIRCLRCAGRGQVLVSADSSASSKRVRAAKARARSLDKPCKTCWGQPDGPVHHHFPAGIPPGVDNGTRLRSSGNGAAGQRVDPPGPLRDASRRRNTKSSNGMATTSSAKFPLFHPGRPSAPRSRSPRWGRRRSGFQRHPTRNPVPPLKGRGVRQCRAMEPAT